MAQPDIVIYSASWCPYCARALALLKSKDVQVTVIDVDAQPDKRAEMQSRTGRRTVPSARRRISAGTSEADTTARRGNTGSSQRFT